MSINIKTYLVIILIIVTLFTLLNFSSCDDGPTNTVEEDKPGKRDYMWTVDTLETFNPLYRLWGSSPTDLWAITTGTYYEDIFHFDGSKWKTGTYLLPDPYSPYSIYGFASNSVFIGGGNGRIWQYDGSSIKEVAALTKDGRNDLVFDNIWGESPNSYYAFGAYTDENGYANNAVIAHFYNNKWEMLNTDGLFGIVEHLYKGLDNKIYLQVIGGKNYNDSTKIYEYSGGKYINLYSNIWTQGLQADISLINREVYFAIGSEIKKRINNQFQTVLKVDNPNFYQRIWGRNGNDIFLMMVDGLAHYNGTNIEYLFDYNFHTQIFGAALFEDDVFFLINNTQGKNLIYHGKLK